MTLVARDNLNNATDPSLGAFTAQQNRGILIAGLVCSSVSLIVTLVTLRWFVLMKRLFRHRLVLFLILSDTFKALWYFIFPLVVFSRGPVRSSSAWCQASGFLLSFGVEASDFSILLIALHAMLYIFRPPVRIGKGGLYRYRKWLPAVWLGPPILSASLAFINHGEGYVTAGTFCYLPKRPIWYRLALAYIPRYIILITIFAMYAAISIYVRVKFRGFRDLIAGDSGSNYDLESERSTSISESVAPDDIELAPDAQPSVLLSPPAGKRLSALGSNVSPRGSSNRGSQNVSAVYEERAPWENVNFITATPLNVFGVEASDFASPTRGSASSEETRVAQGDGSTSLQIPGIEKDKLRQHSDAPTTGTTRTDDTSAPRRRRRSRQEASRDPLQRTRSAIRQQLRFLFVYPAVYALMWAFPFAQNCTLYSDYYAAHPVYWLQVLSTCTLSLQAAVDCLVFSWREKPWRRIDQKSRFSIPFWREQSVIFIKRMSFNSPDSSRKNTLTGEHEGFVEAPTPAVSKQRNWWEEEGKKRKDSVWLGTDLLSKIASKQSNPEEGDTIETIEEERPSPS